MIVVKSFDGATGTEVQLEAHVVVAGAAPDVNGLAPVGRGIFTAASQIAQIFSGIPRLRDATNDKIAHVAGQPLLLLEPIVDTARREGGRAGRGRLLRQQHQDLQVQPDLVVTEITI